MGSCRLRNSWVLWAAVACLLVPTLWSSAEVAGADLPKALIIGDSISIGYTPVTQALVAGKVDVRRIPVNGQHTGVGLQKLSDWLGDVQWDVIHVNWGLHDLCYRGVDENGKRVKDKVNGKMTTTLEQYETNLRELVKRLEQTGAALRWASTTPVPEGEPGRLKGDAVKYNAVAAKVMKDNGIVINDLYAHVFPHLEKYQKPGGNVHFTEEGSRFLAEKVAASILNALERRGEAPTAFRSAWPNDVERPWVGPEYWANRLQDWRIVQGRLECVEGRRAKPLRTVHLLTRCLGADEGDLTMRVTTGPLGEDTTPADGAAGFLIGAGPALDYRAAALVHHSGGPGGGILALVDGQGRAVFRDMSAAKLPVLAASETTPGRLPREVELSLEAKPAAEGYTLILSVQDTAADSAISQVTLDHVASERLVGSLALVSHPGPAKKGKQQAAGVRFWFRDWRLSGSKLKVHDDRMCGPVLSTQYTLSRGALKMTAQMMPLGEADRQTVRLEVERDGQWHEAATTEIVAPGYTAPFRAEPWDATRDTPYRVVYDLEQADGTTKAYAWSGTVRHDPVDQDVVTVAAFTGNHNVRHGGVDRGSFEWTKAGCWFPHNELVGYVATHKPDVLFFSGDQVYEGASPTRPEAVPLDYLYKWYLWCWAFRDLARDRPCICIPDDHDVYQGNLWGAGGRKAERQDDGGYTRPVEFVKQTERTQTSHLPDPCDPTPVEQGIGVYYCAMNYGGLSFAILEDRKFKSSATVMVPEGQVVNGWFQNPDFDPATQADVPGATLLGERQLRFLDDWAQDWSHGAQMKVVLSQTLFSNVATLPAAATSDKVVPKMTILPPDVYAENDQRAADADSDGWPQTGRNNAIRAWRRGFAFHICGDQHLGSTIQYGAEDWRDAGFALCVPSIANFFPRRWFPPEPGLNQRPGAMKYTGDYLDGFGNHMTVHAVSNPAARGIEPANLYDRAPGYGIVRLNKQERTITIECWPRWEDPAKPDAKQYTGWPITIAQADNYGREAAAYLPTLDVTGLPNPVVQVIDEANGEVAYTLRINGTSFRPKVFREGAYTLKVGEPDAGKMKTLTGVRAIPPERTEKIQVAF